jgi:hypothetical protein
MPPACRRRIRTCSSSSLSSWLTGLRRCRRSARAAGTSKRSRSALETGRPGPRRRHVLQRLADFGRGVTLHLLANGSGTARQQQESERPCTLSPCPRSRIATWTLRACYETGWAASASQLRRHILQEGRGREPLGRAVPAQDRGAQLRARAPPARRMACSTYSASLSTRRRSSRTCSSAGLRTSCLWPRVSTRPSSCRAERIPPRRLLRERENELRQGAVLSFLCYVSPVPTTTPLHRLICSHVVLRADDLLPSSARQAHRAEGY